MKNYFYIIQRNKHIVEVEYTEERFKSCLEQWQKGGIIIFPFLGTGINCVDVVNIFSAEQYEDFIFSANPKQYIKDGTWYDGKENRIIRNSKWKQEEIDKREKLREAPIADVSPEERERVNAIGRKYLDSIRPNKSIPKS